MASQTDHAIDLEGVEPYSSPLGLLGSGQVCVNDATRDEQNHRFGIGYAIILEISNDMLLMILE